MSLQTALDFAYIGQPCPICKKIIQSVSKQGNEIRAQCGHVIANIRPIVRKTEYNHERGAGRPGS